MADFVLGRIKFVWKGTWAASTAYISDDVVKYGGNSFICVVNHTSASTFEADLSANPTKWQKMVSGQAFKGDYANATYYAVDDVVKYGASLWICTTAYTSGATLDETKFSVYVPGLEFEDSWASGTAYQSGDIVTYGGYQYIAITQSTGVTPTDASSEWEVLTTGYKHEGTYAAGTAYKTGDVVQYGGNTYVCKLSHAAGAKIPTETSNYDLLVEGISLQSSNGGLWASGTQYLIGQTIIYQNSTYRAIRDTIGDTPDTSTADWQLHTKGDVSGVFTTRGDIAVHGPTIPIRLPLGPKGARLVSDGDDIVWSEQLSSNTWYVGPKGDDAYPGTLDLPFKTLKHACEMCALSGIMQFDTIAGGTGGTAGSFYNVSGTGGSGKDALFNVTTDGSSTPTITLVSSGSGFAVGNTITIAKALVGNSTADITFAVTNISEGDKVNVLQGNYYEMLPIRVPPKATIEGEALRGTIIQPVSGSVYGSQIATATHVAGGTGGTPGTFKKIRPTTLGQEYTVATAPDATSITVALGTSGLVHTYVSGGTLVKANGTSLNITNAAYNNVTGVITITTATHGLSASDVVRLAGMAFTCSQGAKTYPKLGDGSIWNVVTDGSSTPTYELYHGGHGYADGQVLEFTANTMGTPSTAATIKVASRQLNSGSNFFLLNNGNNMRSMTYKGGTDGMAVMSLDPTGAITTTSPYIQNSTNIHTSGGVTGIKIDGDAQTSGYISILGNDFTQINNDGIGCHVMNKGRAELVSVFTYYCDKAIYAESGGFVRGLNSSMSYGEYGAYAEGTDPDETPVAVISRGEEIAYQTGTLSGVTEVAVGDTLTGGTSGATATVVGVVTPTRKLQIDSITGNFSRGESVTGAGSGSFTFTLNTTGGDFESAKTITGGVTQANPGVVTSASHGLQNGNEVTFKDVVGMTQLNGNKYFVKSVATNTFELASTVGGTNVDTSGFGAYGSAGSFIPHNANSGQTGYLIRVDSTDATLATAGALKVGANIEFNHGAMADAAALLTANKEFIKDEAMSWFDTTYPGAHTTDRHTKCERDVGYTVDALIADLTNDNADLTKEYAEKYWVGAVNQLANAQEVTYAVAVFNKVEEIINTKILINSAWTTGQSPVVTTQSYTNSNGESACTTRVTELIAVFNNVVQNGLGVVPVGNGGRNYAVVAVTDEDTSNKRATVKVNTEITLSGTPVKNNVATNARRDYSNIRLTGHDWLNIGTGDLTTTNYPGVPTQPADQGRETTTGNGGRVYWAGTDQDGDFRVGDLFRVQQSTGIATLNADAFDLSGLTELQLGSIGAQIGSTINEFSSDGTLSGNSDVAVPTEQAVKTYVDSNSMSTGKAIAMAIVFG